MKNKINTFSQLNRKQKLQYIWDYYKIHIIVTAAIICILFSIIRTVQKNHDIDLYVAYVNIAADDNLLESIDDVTGLNISNYTNLLITEDPASDNLEYAYASSMKLMSAISAGKLDIIVADSYGIEMANNAGYLTNPKDYLESKNPALANQLENYYIEDESCVPYAIDLSYSNIFVQAGFSEHLYVGIVASEEVSPEVSDYLLSIN